MRRTVANIRGGGGGLFIQSSRNAVNAKAAGRGAEAEAEAAGAAALCRRARRHGALCRLALVAFYVVAAVGEVDVRGGHGATCRRAAALAAVVAAANQYQPWLSNTRMFDRSRPQSSRLTLCLFFRTNGCSFFGAGATDVRPLFTAIPPKLRPELQPPCRVMLDALVAALLIHPPTLWSLYLRCRDKDERGMRLFDPPGRPGRMSVRVGSVLK